MSLFIRQGALLLGDKILALREYLPTESFGRLILTTLDRYVRRTRTVPALQNLLQVDVSDVGNFADTVGRRLLFSHDINTLPEAFETLLIENRNQRFVQLLLRTLVEHEEGNLREQQQLLTRPSTEARLVAVEQATPQVFGQPMLYPDRGHFVLVALLAVSVMLNLQYFGLV